MRIRDVINRILWKYGKELENYYLVIVDRLDISGFKRIPFSHIQSVDNYYVYISSGMDTTAIPIHRVVMIEDASGVVIWSREKSSKRYF
ncbi:MAG: RNA repair domain-containing protein [Sulfolobales archaeon]|nr:RNA repair domain-containing protein [Ignisphaera sp.]MCX8199791.1 RNA repair domain-containing protein [Sulfolobales archaeon]MDW8084970.1 RNA repair domain-containing protein [Ignisphaera sp.]